MNYDSDQFLRLIDAVEDQGGTLLGERCKGTRVFDLTGDRKIEPKDRTLNYCGQAALFEVPYEGEDGGSWPVTVCAVDDDMGRWPRFADQVAG